MNSEREILIIDDNLGMRIGFDHFFRKQGFQVKKVNSSEKGLDYIQQARPLAILCDVGLPGLNGYEACRLAKTNPASREIPFILISSHSAAELRQKGGEAGADFFISKPVSPIDVVDDMELLYENEFSSSERILRLLKVIKRTDQDQTEDSREMQSAT